MDQETKKIMTMHKALHHKDDIDRLDLSQEKKEEEDMKIVLMN